ncbi:MAG: DUF4474 domain-containing protein [Clostridia bacterium]|nr:DUF4474 domain-containing protein [Clostridia bacterium]
MKKNVIIYIVAGAIVLAGLATAGVFAFKKLNGNQGETTEPTLNYGEVTDFGENGYEIVEPPSDEFYTNENGEPVEYVTDEEGSTYEVVLQTNANGETQTQNNGEKVTANKPTQVVTGPIHGTTRPGSVTPTPTTKPSGGTTSGGNDGLSGGNTVQKNPDGSQSIIKPDGTIALSYSYSEAGNYFYTDDNPWQRNFGFNRLYDIGAVFTVMYLDTFHVYYNHGGYDWMVQFWKGQYGLLFLGGEIGLYYKDPSKTTPHYNCAEENMEINMQMSVYRGDEYKELFTRPYAPHWWTTAFVPGKLKKFSDRTELTMVAKLEFKSVEEREKFCNALEKIDDVDGNRFRYASSISISKPEYYTYSGSTVDLVWRYLDEDRVTPLKPVATTTQKPVEGETTKKPETTNPATSTTKPVETQAPSFD